jgi:hypothetical protein
VLITVRQLEEQASYIAGQPKKVLVPQYVLSAARSAINARSRCAEWFQGIFPTAGGGDGHCHFIDRLRVMLETLEPHAAPVGDGKKQAIPKSAGNKYELLDFQDTPMQEETLVADAGVSTVSGPNKTADQKAKTSAASVQNKVRQYMFHFYCTIIDIYDIRQHVKTVWKDYSHGKVDLFVASVITEIAFQLLSQLEEEITRAKMLSQAGPLTGYIQTKAIWETICENLNVKKVYTKDHPLKAFAELLGIPSASLVFEMLLGRVITDDILEEMLDEYDASFLIPAASIIEDTVYCVQGSMDLATSSATVLPGICKGSAMRCKCEKKRLPLTLSFPPSSGSRPSPTSTPFSDPMWASQPSACGLALT